MNTLDRRTQAAFWATGVTALVLGLVVFGAGIYGWARLLAALLLPTNPEDIFGYGLMFFVLLLIAGVVFAAKTTANTLNLFFMFLKRRALTV